MRSSEYPAPDAVLTDIDRRGADPVIRDIMAMPPFAYAASSDEYDAMLTHVGDQLGVPKGDIALVGSGRLGFSLAPEKWGRAYGPASDLDLVIVSADLFHQSWLEVGRRWRRRFRLDARTRAACEDHRQNLIFYGRMRPARLPGVLSLAPRWFSVLRSPALGAVAAARTVNAELYDCWDHALGYQRFSLTRSQSARRAQENP